MSYRTKKNLWKLLVYLLMAVIVVICLFPVVWSCIISIKSVGEKVSGFSALTVSQPRQHALSGRSADHQPAHAGQLRAPL